MRRLELGAAVIVWALSSGPRTSSAQASSAQASSPRTSSAQASAESSGAGAADGAARLWARDYITWIYGEPRRDRHAIGYLRAGSSAALRAPSPVSHAGCRGGWYAIEPTGFVCVGAGGALAETRYVRAMQSVAPAPGVWPFSYALSYGTPTYRRLPSAAEAARAERAYGPAGSFPELPRWWAGRQELTISGSISASASMPEHFSGGGSVVRAGEGRVVRRAAPLGTLLAYTSAFTHEGRTWVSSADGTLVPADRLRPFRASSFAGVELGGERGLPLAWGKTETPVLSVREASECQCASSASSCTLAESCLGEARGHLAVREVMSVSEQRVYSRGRVYRWARATRGEPGGAGVVAERDVRIASQRRRPPEVGPEDKWIAFRVTEGVLVAYVGDRAVFATLASPGSGGRPRAGGDPLSDRTTPTGSFRVLFKHWTDDMSPEDGEHRSYWLAEVPFAQYFAHPFAIHVVYWHERFGEPMSGGCINVSPADGRRLFDWTEPTLPPGWHGIGVSSHTGRGTLIVSER